MRLKSGFIYVVFFLYIPNLMADQISELINKLQNSSYFKVRTQAALILGKTGRENVDRVIDPLISALRDEHYIVRGAAAIALGSIGDLRAVEPLIQSLADEESLVRQEAKNALQKIVVDARALPYLEVALDSYDMRIRKEALNLLRNIKNEKAYKLMVRSLVDPEGDVREIAINCIGELEEGVAVKILIDVLRTGKYPVKVEVAKRLGSLGSKSALWPLAEIIVSEVEVPEVKKAAAESLRILSDKIDITRYVTVANSDPDYKNRSKAIVILGYAGGDPSIDAILQALRDENLMVRAHAVQSLCRIGSIQHVAELEQMLRDPKNDRIHSIIKSAIFELNKKR